MTDILFWNTNTKYAVCFDLVFKVFDRIKIDNKCQRDCLLYKKTPNLQLFEKKNGSLRIDNWLLGCHEQDINKINNWNMERKLVKTHTVRFCGLDWCRPCRQGSLFIRHNTFSQTILFSCPVVHYVILYFIYSHDLPTYWKVIITNHMIWHSDLKHENSIWK